MSTATENEGITVGLATAGDASDKAMDKAVDDATVVHDDPVVAEEKAHDELVAKVTKRLDKDKKGDAHDDKPAGEPAGEGEEETPSEEEPSEKSLSKKLQTRAKAANISDDLAQTLHQYGQLEETLAASDRTLIDRFSDAETQPKADEDPKSGDDDSAKPKKPTDQKSLPELDPEVYGEELVERDKQQVERDKQQMQRMDSLESLVADLLEGDFSEKFDVMVDAMGHEDLFGKGDSVPEDKQANRDTLLKAYEAVCQMHDVDPRKCKAEWAERAMAAMFPKEVFKQAQKQTVDRLRNAEGKFLSSSASKGAPPAKAETEEEANDALVSKVDAYYKKHGIDTRG